MTEYSLNFRFYAAPARPAQYYSQLSTEFACCGALKLNVGVNSCFYVAQIGAVDPEENTNSHFEFRFSNAANAVNQL